MPRTKSKSRATRYFAAAFREAGHAVAAWDRGVMLMPVSIFPNGPGAGKNVWNDALRNVDFEWIKSVESPALAERLAAILMAGPVAQRYFLPASPMSEVYRKRLGQARRLLDASRGGRDGGSERFDELRGKLEFYFGRRHAKNAVTALAKALLLEGTVTGDNAAAIVESNARVSKRRP